LPFSVPLHSLHLPDLPAGAGLKALCLRTGEDSDEGDFSSVTFG